MRAALLGFTIPDQLYAEIADSDAVLPAQTHRFSWALVEALRSGGAREVRLISAAPVSSYPHNRRLFWPRGRWSAHGVEGVYLPFVNAPVLKHLSRFLSCWWVARHELKRSRPDWLIVHGVHSPFLWFAVLAKRRARTRIAVVLTDPPGVVRAADGFLTRFLKRYDVAVITAALRRFDAVITLTEALSADFAPSVPALVMEGIHSTSRRREDLAPALTDARPTIIYAGGVQREYGIAALVEAVSESDLDVDLRVFGKGPDEALVRHVGLSDERIIGPELVHPDELAAWYAGATALVQPRPIDQSFVPYSFPSKLIEYLGTGIPVVSTRLPSIPSDYEEFVVWAETDTPEGLRDAIRRVLGWDEVRRRRFGGEAREFVTSTRSSAAQGRRLVEFLERCP